MALWEEADSDEEAEQKKAAVAPAKKTPKAGGQAVEARAADAIQRAGFKLAPGVANAKTAPARKRQESSAQPQGRPVSGKRKSDSAAPSKSSGAKSERAKDA